MEIKRILSTTVLTVALMATACAPKASGPVDKDDGHHSITVNNLAEMEADWMAGGSTRTIDISLKEDGADKKAIEEQAKGNLTFEIGDTSIATNSGFIFTALKVGKTTVAVKYGDSVKVVNLNIVEKPDEPAVVTGKTVAQILEDVKTTGQTRIYELNGKVKNFATKTEWNQYGELNVIDDSTNDPVYIYGSYVNTEAEPAYFEWNGEQYTGAKYTTRNALTNDMTKDTKKGDIVKLNVMYSTQYNNFYGIWLSRTDGPVVPATSVTLNKTELTLEEGANETLTFSVEPENWNQKPVWASSDTSVATVSGGRVVAVKAGTTNVTVTVGEQVATCAVTVTKPAANLIRLTPDNLLGYNGTDNVAYQTEETEYTCGGLKYGVKQVGCFGNGLQFRKADGVGVGYVYNKETYASDIEEFGITLQTGKTGYSNEDIMNVYFASTLEGLASATPVKISTVAGTADYSVTVPTGARFFKIDNAAAAPQTMYLASINITLK